MLISDVNGNYRLAKKTEFEGWHINPNVDKVDDAVAYQVNYMNEREDLARRAFLKDINALPEEDYEHDGPVDETDEEKQKRLTRAKNGPKLDAGDTLKLDADGNKILTILDANARDGVVYSIEENGESKIFHADNINDFNSFLDGVKTNKYNEISQRFEEDAAALIDDLRKKADAIRTRFRELEKNRKEQLKKFKEEYEKKKKEAEEEGKRNAEEEKENKKKKKSSKKKTSSKEKPTENKTEESKKSLNDTLNSILNSIKNYRI